MASTEFADSQCSATHAAGGLLVRKRITVFATILVTMSMAAPPHASATPPGRNGVIAYLTEKGVQLTTPTGRAKGLLVAGTGATPLEWSPSGSHLLYYYNDHLWSVRADGRYRRRLTRGLFSASWSPNGRWIVFERGIRGDMFNTDVFKMRRDGSSVTRLTYTAGGASSGAPAWSPDGRWIAFVRDGRMSGTELFVMNPRGRQVTQMTDWGLLIHGVDWHPRSNQLVGTAFDVDCHEGMGTENSTHLFRLNVYTGATRTLARCADFSGPVWSPNGRRIATHVSGFRPTELTPPEGLYTMRADGTDVRRIVRGFASWPAWRPTT